MSEIISNDVLPGFRSHLSTTLRFVDANVKGLVLEGTVEGRGPRFGDVVLW